MENWNDLKLVLAIARAGRLGGGAAALAVNHSTAFRRLNAIEEKLGVRLFDRLPGGIYAATKEGDRFAATAEHIETEVMTLDREVLGSDARPKGTIRVTAPEPLSHSLLAAHLAQFRQAYPGIVVELIADDRVLGLSRREADIALRDSPRDPALFGRRLVDVAWALYASVDRVQQEGLLSGPSGLGRRDIISWGTESRIASAEWLRNHVPEERVVYRSSSITNQLAAARAGMGIALLPCYLGDGAPGLTRAAAHPIDDLTRELWIVTHADLRKTARIRAFLDTVGNSLAAQQALFSGNLNGAAGK
jgi:DNA-binding transcriptional LysR family regulator